jgi:hypothetical protein
MILEQTARKKISAVAVIFSSALILCMFTGCPGYSPMGGPAPLVKRPLTTEAEPVFQPLRYNALIVLPLESALPGKVSSTKLAAATRSLVNAFQANTGLEILNIANPEAMKKFGSGDELLQRADATPIKVKAAKLGKSSGAQAVLYGVMSAFDAESVGFRLWLLDAATGADLWSATFDVADDALSENLFQLPGFIRKENLTRITPENALDRAFVAAATEFSKLRK